MSAFDRHFTNFAAITVPLGNIILHGPEILSWVTGLLGVCWYIALFIDRRARIKREKDAR